jgi:cellulose synthase/poly-beta-1,6-N-acetylglucosamine synthase-like glycosyltransferase
MNWTPAVSVIIAVHNGASFIAKKLTTLLNLDYPSDRIEFIIVSDGSTDETVAIINAVKDPRIRCLSKSKREGKAAAVNQAIGLAQGDILFFTDVRQPLDRQALRHLAANFADPTVGAVTGELRIIKGDSGEQADMDLYWRYELWARAKHSSIYSLFNTTGCIYAMRKELVHPIPVDTLTDDIAYPLEAFFAGYRIIFDPAAIAYDYPTVSGTEFRRRFRTLAGLWQIHARIPALFSGQNRMRFHFLSHKFSRLLLPWVILAIYVSTVFLPDSDVRTFLLVNEGILILLAVLDFIVPRRLALFKRITSPARTFLVMNVAALAAILVFLIPANKLWVPTRVNSVIVPKD